MAFSKVDICNKALNYIGATPIASLTENTNSAVRISYIYDTVRDYVLREYPWGFAQKIQSLNQISDETVTGWDYLYSYPSKSLSISKIFVDTGATEPENVEYKVFLSPTTNVKCIASDYSPLYIQYTYQIDDSTLYDSDFVEAFSLKLAAEIAFTLTGNLDLAPRLEKKYEDCISEAKRSNSNEEKVDVARTSSFEDARS